jgi:hypothetical protein
MNDFERHFNLKTHLKVIGTILESSEFYTDRRKDLFKSIVIQSIEQSGKECSSKDILKILQYENKPLINKGRLIGILNQLKEENKISSVKRNNIELYFFTGDKSNKKTKIQKSLKSAYRRFVFTNTERYFNYFQEVLVETFSELGINTVNHLFIKKQTYSSSIEEIIDRKRSLIAEEHFADFKEGILSFFESDLEEAKSIKVSMAQAYTALKMMGVGNWQKGELDKILAEKTLVIDSNVLFSYISSQSADKNAILDIFKDLKLNKNVKFILPKETKEEFLRAVSHQLKELKLLYKKNVSVNLFHENNTFDLDWFDLFKSFTTDKCPVDEIENFYGYITSLITIFSTELECSEPYIDTIDIENNESDKEKPLKQLIFEKSRKPKSLSALKHDCLVWNYLEENQSVRLFTHDSIWRYVKINNTTKSINAGDLFLYLTIGSYESSNFSKVLNHVIKNNILQDSNLLTMEEISSLANAEEKVLALPRAKRRELISKIHDLKRTKLDSGQPIVSNEISALAFSYLVSTDNQVAESNQVKYLESQLKEKSDKLKQQEDENSNLTSKLKVKSDEVRNFRVDKRYLVGSLTALIVTSITTHYLHKYFEVSTILLSIPVILVVLYTIVGLFRGFSKSWTIVTTTAALIFSIIPLFTTSNIHSKAQASIEKEDTISTRASSIKKDKASIKKKEIGVTQ